MRLGTLSIAGIGTAALVFASLASGAPASGSDAAGGHAVSLDAAGTSSSHAGTAAKSTPSIDKAKCKTKFAPPAAPDPNGLIAWNNNDAPYNTAGAVDFKCKRKTTIKKVLVYGYSGGQVSGLYNVSFYKDSGPDALNEPLDSSAFCSFTDLPGALGGSYPVSALTTLTLPGTGCKVKRGTYWLSVQTHDASGPWYWEVTNTQQGFPGDWIDRDGAFTPACHTFDTNGDGGDVYLSTGTDCLMGYEAYLDYRFMLQ